MELLQIDGNKGEGGGQILRTSLALSAITGMPISINNIRSGRPKPGLQRQHLTAVLAAAKVSGAEVHGAYIDSQSLSFLPGKPMSGDYHFDIGSAGSTTLVFQTILPILLKSGHSSTVTITGGTHNPMAPSAEFLEESFLNALTMIGVTCSFSLRHHGFYPAGGGVIVSQIEPWLKFQPLSLIARGELKKNSGRILYAHLPEHIPDREQSAIAQELHWSMNQIEKIEVNSNGPGNMVILKMEYENVVTIVSSCGELRKSAEHVALAATENTKAYLDTQNPVCEHLADQLLLPLAMGEGGEFITCSPSQHLITNMEIISRFLGPVIAISEKKNKSWLVSVKPSVA